MEETKFFEQFGATIKGKQLLFYCSVGYHSSHFATRVQQKALQRGAHSVANLKGGIFRWYNEGNPVVNQNGPTEDIHPFNEEWGTLLERRQQ